MKIGVFTVSTPEYEPIELLEKLAALGYDGVEWRMTEDKGDRSKPSYWEGNRTTLTAEEAIARGPELRARARSLGLEIASVAAYVDCQDLAKVDLHLEATAALGATNCRVNSGTWRVHLGRYWDMMRACKAKYAKVAGIAARHGVRALIETHPGQLCPSVFKALWVLEGLDPRHVGIMWDPSNQISEGGEKVPMVLDMIGPYLAEVQVKNARYVSGPGPGRQTLWKNEPCPVWAGIIDWPNVLKLLRQAGYDGWLFFEDFSTDQPTETKLREDVAWFRELLAAPVPAAPAAAPAAPARPAPAGR